MSDGTPEETKDAVSRCIQIAMHRLEEAFPGMTVEEVVCQVRHKCGTLQTIRFLGDGEDKERIAAYFMRGKTANDGEITPDEDGCA